MSRQGKQQTAESQGTHAQRSRPRLALLGLLVLLSTGTACQRPCKTLADRLCEAAGSDDQACERWKERVGRVSTSTCEAGLRALDRQRLP